MQAPASERTLPAVGRFTPRTLPRPSILRLAGALDAFTVKDALPRMDSVAEDSHVVVDLAALELLDSAGVHALVTLYKRVTAKGGKMVVINAHDQPLAVLGVLNLKAVFGV